MLKPLLTLKHWQIFVALFGGMILFEFLAFSSIFTAAASNQKPQIEDFQRIIYIIPIMMLYVMYFTYGWQWAIIELLRNKLPSDVKIPHRRVKIFFFIPIIYMILILFLILYFVFSIINHPDPEHFFEQSQLPIFIGITFAIITPLHLFSIFCIFHSMFFAAKTMKSVELQREVTFNDFAAEFFLIWFNIIGIWILQPRLNKIITNETEFSTDVVDDLKDDNNEVL
ncbi:MAG: hypothetical protein HUJ25_07795 [Crocinitomicaceae bacterium]|nr:hypothetical protein [Crocinitomicaceae bacterium]